MSDLSTMMMMAIVQRETINIRHELLAPLVTQH